MKPIYLVVGVPGSGKTWVCKQVEDRFKYVPHDHYDEAFYHLLLVSAHEKYPKPALGEIPFGLSKIHESIVSRGVRVVPLFILEEEGILRDRYWKREGKEIIKGHLTRQKTYAKRAKEMDAFFGTSEQVLKHLKEITHETIFDAVPNINSSLR